MWIDVDTCVLGSLKGLESIDMASKSVAGVREKLQPPPGTPEILAGSYINAGVLLMNLEYIRENKLDEEWLELLRNNKYLYPDQDVINLACRGSIIFLDADYNFGPVTASRIGAPLIYHCTIQKLWDNPFVNLWRRNYIKFLGDKPELE